MTNGTNQGDGYQPWQGAPSFVQIAASQQGGSRGAQLWGLTYSGLLYSIYQETPGGGWSQWLGPKWNSQPGGFIDIAAAQQNNGNVILAALDQRQALWQCGQTSPGGNWTQWQGPGWNSAPPLDSVAASQQGGSRGAQLWGGADDAGALLTSYQETPGGSWSQWFAWPYPETPAALDVSAAQQNNGNVQLFVVDQNSRLWTASQTSPGGSWTNWSGPNWNDAPPVFNVEAVQQGGSRGAQVWGITLDYELYTSYQETPGGSWSQWFAWPYPNTPQVVELAAAQQNDGRVQLWAITSAGTLISTYQTSPGGNWTNWNQ